MGQDQSYERHTIAGWHPDTGLRPLSGSDRTYTSLHLSPDGGQLLLVARLGPLDRGLLVSPVSGLAPSRIRTVGAPYAAIWQPDGGTTYAARESERSRFAIYSIPAHDLNDPSVHQELVASPRPLYPTSWDSTTRHLVLH